MKTKYVVIREVFESKYSTVTTSVLDIVDTYKEAYEFVYEKINKDRDYCLSLDLACSEIHCKYNSKQTIVWYWNGTNDSKNMYKIFTYDKEK